MPTSHRGRRYSSVQSCVEETLARVGKNVVLALPLGLGKANHIANEFFRRAKSDRTLRLRIVTALTLERPSWNNGLEQRFLEPLSERIFGDYPDLDYALARRDGTLPPNVEVIEFFYPTAHLLNNEYAQRNYISSNYTHAARDLAAFEVNVLAQLVAPGRGAAADRFSLSCNTDLSLDLIDHLRAREVEGAKVAVLGQANTRLPYMAGEAELAAGDFDGLLESERYDFELFGPPNPAVSSTDYAIALHATCLIKDGGSLQLGIGSMADAVTFLLQMRHENPDTFAAVLRATGFLDPECAVVREYGGIEPFQQGLYASTEMLADGYLDLYRSGILKRLVYDDAGLQTAVDARGGGDHVDRALLEALLATGAIRARLSLADFELLQRTGVFRKGIEFREGRIRAGDTVVPADLSEPRALTEVVRHCLGERLLGGVLAHAGFFLGPKGFYQALAEMDADDRAKFRMTRISYVNQLYGNERLKRAQRRHARFLNSGLMATAMGAVVSDGLEDGRVLSGVGGQYNFVAMAHELHDARSILMVRATSERDGELRSNVVWNYGHTTIPRHLRDIVVTEYGVADLRGKRDQDVIDAMICVADSRFQDDLVRSAVASRKLPANYRVPDRARKNLPERIERAFAPYRKNGLFAAFPFGTDYSREEIVLGKALRALAQKLAHREFSITDLSKLGSVVSPPPASRPYLERLRLQAPKTISETIMQKAALYALELIDAI